jgi:hypothetical protein
MERAGNSEDQRSLVGRSQRLNPSLLGV